MDFSEALSNSLSKQGISLELSSVPFNVFLKNTGDVLTLCFLEEESDDYLIVVETNVEGAEELRIIPKENIEYLSIFYDFTILDEKEEDKMFM